MYIVGYNAAFRDEINHRNTVVGYKAGYQQKSGDNIFIGHKAGQQAGTNGTGDSNIVIGVDSVAVAPGTGVGECCDREGRAYRC